MRLAAKAAVLAACLILPSIAAADDPGWYVGLDLGSIATATIPSAPSDQIVGQSPPANAVNVSEPKISLLLAASEDRASFVMPDLVGQSEDAAVNAIARRAPKEAIWNVNAEESYHEEAAAADAACHTSPRS